jgi:hypothetical protein
MFGYVECICPVCKLIHLVKMRFIGGGYPQIICDNCKKERVEVK